MVIYANQGLRASTRAVMEVFREILKADGTTSSENRMVPLSTIFELQGTGELLAHDALYVRGPESPAYDPSHGDGSAAAAK